MREPQTTTDAEPDAPEDESHYCGWCGELRSDLNAALPFCDRCLAERVPAALLVKIATTALSALEARLAS